MIDNKLNILLVSNYFNHNVYYCKKNWYNYFFYFYKNETKILVNLEWNKYSIENKS